MPQMANITVKKADNTTDVIYTALTPSAGDTVAAQWSPNAVSAIAARRPVVSVTTKWNGRRDGRQFTVNGIFPVFDEGGLKIGTIPMTFSGTVGRQIPDTDVAEAVHQFTNILAHTLMRESIKSGFAPT